MPGETLQHLRLFQPMLEKLGRQFDKIARHIGAGKAREAHLAEQAMQGMAHLMEQGHGIVEGQQAGIGFVEIGIVDDDGQDIVVAVPPSRCWSRKLDIQAPPCLPGRAK